MTNTENTTNYVTRVSGLPREVVDTLHSYGVPAVDVDGDVHTWSFPGTAAEAEALLNRKRAEIRNDERVQHWVTVSGVEQAAWKLFDQVARILAAYIENGHHDQVQVERIGDPGRKGIRLGDLEDIARREERLDSEKLATIHMARVDGCSWTEIGKALGISKQAAQDWYSRRVG